MKTIAGVLLLVFWTISGLAQGSTPPLQPLPVSDTKGVPPRPILSDQPSTDELARAFESSLNGIRSPIEVVQAIISKGEVCVEPLIDILRSESTQVIAVYEDSVERQVRGPLANRVLAVSALGGICSPKSISALFEFAVSHTDIEVRGASLNVLANSYYYTARDGLLTPDPEVLHVLLKNLDDPTLVPSIQRAVSDISGDGLRRWLGDQQCPSPSPTPSIVFGKDKQTITTRQYRELWWNERRTKFTWDKEDSRFDLL